MTWPFPNKPPVTPVREPKRPKPLYPDDMPAAPFCGRLSRYDTML